MRSTASILTLACLSLSFALAQEPPPAFERETTAAQTTPHASSPQEATQPDIFEVDPNAPKVIRVMVEYVELSHVDLTRLLQADQSTFTNSSALRKQAQELVDKGQGKVIETIIVSARSGERATAESHHELIHPTQYGQPTVETVEKDGRETIHRKAPGAPLPEAFETRNVGASLEVEPTTGADENLVSIRLAPELVYDAGTSSWHEAKDANGTINRMLLPDFIVLRLNTACTVVSGQPSMIGVLSPKGQGKDINPDRKVMVFLKCDVLSATP